MVDPKDSERERGFAEIGREYAEKSRETAEKSRQTAEVSRRAPHSICNEHSAMCIRMDHLEGNVQRVCGKLNKLMYLIIGTLIALCIDLILTFIGK